MLDLTNYFVIGAALEIAMGEPTIDTTNDEDIFSGLCAKVSAIFTPRTKKKFGKTCEKQFIDWHIANIEILKRIIKRG